MTAVELEIMEILSASRSEMYGLDIVKWSEKMGGKVKRGTVYVHLGRLEDGGLVSSRKDGERRRYKATSTGRQAMQSAGEAIPSGIKGAPA